MARVPVPAYAGLPRLNLMPRVEVARREREALTRRWVWGVFGAIVLTLLIIAGAFVVQFLAAQRLTGEQARTNDLLIQLTALGEVSQSLATEQELTQFRSQAMANDFAWQPVIANVASVLPSDVVLTGFEVVTGGAPQTPEPATEEGLVGTFTFDSANPVDIVAAVRSLRGVSGVLYADGKAVTSSTVIEGHYAYELTVTFDQTIYSNAFTVNEGTN